jgi:hypothetical protein
LSGTKTRGEFRVTGWDEQPYHEGAAGKQTLAIVNQEFSGGISGTGEARWLMAYRADGTAHFVGLQRVDGHLGGRRGTFVMETSGDFDGTIARWTAAVIAGTPDGQLEGLTGSGEFSAPHGSTATYELDLA